MPKPNLPAKEYGFITNDDFSKIIKALWESKTIQVNGKSFDGAQDVETSAAIALFNQIRGPNDKSQALLGYSYAPIGGTKIINDHERKTNSLRLAAPDAALNERDRLVAAMGASWVKTNGALDFGAPCVPGTSLVEPSKGSLDFFCKIPDKGAAR